MTGKTAQSLAGKIVVVTGGSSGIGRAIALAAARAGADVVLTWVRNAAGAESTAAGVRQLGRSAWVTQADVGDEASVAGLAEFVRRECERADVWINNAGADILTGQGAQLTRNAKLDLLLRVDLKGTMLASWAAAELMRSQPAGGVIINMSWDHVLTGMPGTNPELFAAAKGGVLAFSKALARSVAPHVRVNILGPGWIETAFGANLDDEHRAEVAAGTPLRRWGTPEDVAGVAVFLASDAAQFMTGQFVMINGGVVM
ncbi:MAG: SDR family NAD(P)-dependent oxidoreductase [Gemmatimonadota bacterium]